MQFEFSHNPKDGLPAVLTSIKKIAVMGGTFDPIHYGHLVAAETVRHKLGVERVIFMPSGRPPHKDLSLVSHSEHRYLMCALATADNPHFTVSRMETDRQAASYTIDTIRELRAIMPGDAEIYFITGADAIREILSWKEPEALLQLCRFVSVTRPGYQPPGSAFFPEGALSQSAVLSNMIYMDVPAMDISSSDIRMRVGSGLPIKYLLPGLVEAYIQKHGLYAKAEDLEAGITAFIKAELTKKRYTHTMGVVDAAVKLAVRYGADVHKARLAALLHDCAKDFPEEKSRSYLQRFHIPLDEIMEQQISLAHQYIGAEIARETFGIDDGELLNSIRYHTTGRENMTKLEKVIYVADCIEDYREYYNGLELIRAAAFEDLDKAVAVGLKAAIDYTVDKGKPIHPLSVKALEYFK